MALKASAAKNILFHRRTQLPRTLTTAEEASSVSTDQATENFYKFVRYQGYSIPPRYKVPYIIYSVILNAAGTFFMPFVFTYSVIMTAITETKVDVGPLLISLQVTFDVYSGSIKILIMAFMMKRLYSANAVIKRLDARCRNEDEIAELKKLIRFGRRIVFVFSTVYVTYVISSLVGSVVLGRPPYSLKWPFIDWRRSHLEFFLASLFETCLITLAVIQQTVNDSYAVLYVSILRTHMQILLLRLQKLGSSQEMSLDDNFKELKMCIKDHKNLLDLYNIIAPIISITIFVQFMITATILGTTLINIMIFTTEFSARVGSCVYFFAVLLQIFPLCYFAQSLLDDSDRLAEVIFHSNWMGQDVRYRKMLIFFIQRAQRPMEFTAIKIIPITLNSFLSIAKFSFTLYTFIQKLGIKERFE